MKWGQAAAKLEAAMKAPDWYDPMSGCFCVVCLAPVKPEVFEEHDGCCPDHKPDEWPEYNK